MPPLKPTEENPHVLIVEDDPTLSQIAELSLARIGCQTRTVGDGLAAVEAAVSGEYDLVLMDIHLPVMDGIEATRLIRQHEQATGKHVPIVAVTARACDEEIRRSGVDDCVTKPADYQALVERWVVLKRCG